MAEKIDLEGPIREAVDGAALRGATLALAYVGEDDRPQVSFRGSTQVHGPTQLALWARKRDSGLSQAIATNPYVSLVYFAPEGPGPMFLSIKGKARTAPEADEAVYAAMIEGEREQAPDPSEDGVAVIVDVEEVQGAGADGFFLMQG